MAKTRILVVDDSALVRRLVSDVLSSEPDLEVIGTAPNGRIALAKIRQSRPDAVTLDVEMPEMDGLATLQELRRAYPLLPVIMLSSLTERGAAATLDCLLLGATDYVTKPSGPSAAQALKDELAAKIRAVVPGASSPPPAPVRRDLPAVRDGSAVPEVVVVGASTGGPNALTELLTGLGGIPVPILVVQHMPPLFTRMLAERLAAKTGLRVREAADGEAAQAGVVHVAPGDFHLEVADARTPGRLRLHQGPAENSCRPSVDVLFRSAAKAFRSAVLGVMLTGMGQDGLRGAREVREAGGRILVQDEATSVVWGMPGAVARAGLADDVLPPSLLRQEVLRRTARAPRQGAGRG
jgi:two-component system chemotaxis response regulator CheB